MQNVLLAHAALNAKTQRCSVDCSLVTDKLRLNDVDGAGNALSSALFVATISGLLIQAVLLVRKDNF